MRRASALITAVAAMVLVVPEVRAIEQPHSDTQLAPQLAPELAEAPILPSGQARPNRPSGSSSGSGALGSDRSSGQEEFKYRLIVQGSSDTLLRQVRQIIPDAFRSRINGARVIQAGLFVERSEAETVQQQLSRLNVETSILEIENLAGITSGGSRSTLPTLPVPAQPPSQSSSRLPPPPRSGFQSGSQSGSQGEFKYRLVIQGNSDSLLRQVRRIIPDAFRTRIDGARVIQAGLFVERSEAEVVQRQLAQVDATTSIFDIGYGVTQRSTLLNRPRLQAGRTIVVVDPGHGGGDPGAVGIGGIHEADIVLDVAQQVADLLEKQGIQAVLTRADDQEVELEPRVDLADSVNADLFVSIHANAINLSRPDVNGIETYYYDTGSALASSIHNSLVSTTGMNNRGIHQARFYVLTHSSMPAVLVEIGFVTGQEDIVRFNSASSRSQIAEGIAQGILRYLQ
jgi:N-acetylmuramoyl-L-alanine amidase